jgi:hypothetical protein
MFRAQDWPAVNWFTPVGAGLCDCGRSIAGGAERTSEWTG